MARLGRWNDIAYAATRHAKRRLDIASPSSALLPGARRLPVCVFVHGGSWQRGDKSESVLNRDIDRAFAARGCVGVSVNYRLSPEVQHPEHALDVAAALHWLRSNIDKYGGDPERFVLVGHSAGAHLLLLLLADPQFLRAAGVEDDASAFVRGAVGISGVYNIVRLANAPFYGALVATPAFGERADQWREASVTSALTKERGKSPLTRTPLLLLTAEDDFHFGEDADELEKWLRAAGSSRVERKVIAKRNHFSILRELTENSADEAMQHISQFIQRVVA
ncbi:hypothetical protein PybrP1_006562 [[Pythium] brassicae (nom. inval.)]|nr:hypothetical protein PybrP1_006562 [[Pythium] brassicae (nom. inval.)]